MPRKKIIYPPLTWQRLREVLSYDFDTGVFTWAMTRNKCPVGKVAGSFDRHGYVYIRVDDKLYPAHRLAWLWVFGEWPRQDIDHKNGEKGGNWLGNLRDVSKTINMQNFRSAVKGSLAGVIGASWNALGQNWRAKIRHEGKCLHLGCFQTPQEAHEAYVAAKRRLHAGCTI